jgi:hypothetical protein
MPVTEEDAERLIGLIIKTIEDTPLLSENLIVSDLINQWRSEVEAGRQVEKKLRVKENPRYQFDAGSSKGRPESSGEFIGRIDYKQFEQLEILINTLNLIFVVPEKMAFKVYDTISRIKKENEEGEGGYLSISLAGAGDSIDSKLDINLESIVEWAEGNGDISRLIREISDEIGSKVRLDLSDGGN